MLKQTWDNTKAWARSSATNGLVLGVLVVCIVIAVASGSFHTILAKATGEGFGVSGSAHVVHRGAHYQGPHLGRHSARSDSMYGGHENYSNGSKKISNLTGGRRAWSGPGQKSVGSYKSTGACNDPNLMGYYYQESGSVDPNVVAKPEVDSDSPTDPVSSTQAVGVLSEDALAPVLAGGNPTYTSS